MICPACKNQVCEGAAFCAVCGTRLGAQGFAQQGKTQPQVPGVQPQQAQQLQPVYQQQVPYQQQAPQQQLAYQPTQPQQAQTAYQPSQSQPQTMQQPQQAGRRKVPIGILAGIGAGLILVAVAVAFFVLGRKSAGVPIDEAHFPDGEFRAWVSENADENGDGIITEVEAYKVIRIDVERVASVQGVENFPKVEEVHFTNSELTTLELSDLDELRLVDVSGSEDLKEVNLADLPALEEVWLSETSVDKVTLPEESKAFIVDPPDGLEVVGPDGEATGMPEEDPALPEVPDVTTWLVPVHVQEMITFTGDSGSRGPRSEELTASYDENGQLTHYEKMMSDEDGYRTNVSVDYSYDDEGRLIQIDYDDGIDGSESDSHTWTMTYSESGRHAVRTELTSHSTSCYVDDIYDEEGRLIHRTLDRYSGGLSTEVMDVVYDDDGKVVQIDRYNVKDSDRTYKTSISVDYHVNDRISQLLVHTYYAEYAYKYDENGRLVSYHNYDDCGDFTDYYKYTDSALPSSVERVYVNVFTGVNQIELSSDTLIVNTRKHSDEFEDYEVNTSIEYKEIVLATGKMNPIAIGVSNPMYFSDNVEECAAGIYILTVDEILAMNRVWLAEHGEL